MRGLRQAISFARQQFQADSWVASLAHLGLALALRRDRAPRRGRARGAARRATASLAPAHRWSRSRPARAREGPRRAIPARARRHRPQTRSQDDRGVPRSRAAARDRSHRRAGPHHGQSECRKRPRRRATHARPSSPCCGASRPVSPDARSARQLYISLNTVKTHTRELYRKLGASSRAEAVAQAEALGLLELVRITRVILGRKPPNSRPP